MDVMDHSAHHTPTAHDHATHQAGNGRSGASWSTAAKATLHCLTGCAIGEILGMAIGTALLWGNVPTMILAITLAFIFGYSFTLFAVRRAAWTSRARSKSPSPPTPSPSRSWSSLTTPSSP